MKLNGSHSSGFARLLKKFISLFLFLFLIDFCVGTMLAHFYFRNQKKENYRTTFAVDSTKAELLIFGSSRANHHYRPDILSAQLQATSYNAGRDGEFIFYNWGILKAVLKRYKPKIIILDFSPGDFAKNDNAYERLSVLLPYYRKHPEMRPVIALRSRLEKLKLLSSIYPYNSLILSIFSQNTGRSSEDEFELNGYVPLKSEWKESIETDSVSGKYLLNLTVIEAYDSFIKECNRANVQLIVACSPYYKRYRYPDYSVTIAKKIAEKQNVPFFNCLQDSIFINHSNLFHDPAHLNDVGAALYSHIIADEISTVRLMHKLPKSF